MSNIRYNQNYLNMTEEFKNLIIENPKKSDEGFIGYVYAFVNIQNTKIYIGKTIEFYNKRWNEHKYNAFTKNLNSYFYKALRKYSWEAFAQAFATFIMEFNKTKK